MKGAKETSPPAATGGAREQVRINVANNSENSISAIFPASDSAPEEPLLPQVAAARERDRFARELLGLPANNWRARP